MSTCSYIGIEEPNGEVVFIYCHSDGYLSWNGKVLSEHWKDLESIRAMIGHGDMSTLGETLEDCSFYCRDWQRECNINRAENREALIGEKDKCGLHPNVEGYVYLFNLESREWLVWQEHENPSFIPLALAIELEEKQEAAA